jgi:hypothetical protein
MKISIKQGMLIALLVSAQGLFGMSRKHEKWVDMPWQERKEYIKDNIKELQETADEIHHIVAKKSLSPVLEQATNLERLGGKLVEAKHTVHQIRVILGQVNFDVTHDRKKTLDIADRALTHAKNMLKWIDEQELYTENPIYKLTAAKQSLQGAINALAKEVGKLSKHDYEDN